MKRKNTNLTKSPGRAQKIFAACSVPCVAVLLVMSILSTSTGLTAMAIESLPHIEWWANEMREKDRNFTVLEITAADEIGSFGYYVDGWEPGNAYNWEERLREILDKGDRADYMDDLKQEMIDAGVIDADGPISWTEDYSEIYPWIKDKSGMRKLQFSEELDKDELLLEVGEGNGDIDPRPDFKPIRQHPENPALDYKLRMIINKLEYNYTGDFKYYFIANDSDEFKIDFRSPTGVWRGRTYHGMHTDNDEGPFDINSPATGTSLNPEPPPGTFVDDDDYYYLRIDNGDGTVTYEQYSRYYIPEGTPFYRKTGPTDAEYYVYEGKFGDRGFNIAGLEFVFDYGMAKIYDKDDPSTHPDPNEHGGYYAVVDPAFNKRLDEKTDFVRMDDDDDDDDPKNIPLGARFVVEYKDFDYVGDGNGRYEVNPLGDPGTIFYDHVYYKGGFKNNDWFIKYVFDREDPDDYKSNIKVYSLPCDYSGGGGGSSTATSSSMPSYDDKDNWSLLDFIDAADMIVLRKGAELTNEQAVRIYNRSLERNSCIPVMFDHALNNQGGTIQTLVRSLVAKEEDSPDVGSLPGGGSIDRYNYDSFGINGVKANIFWTSINPAELREIIDDDYDSPQDEFKAVKEEIDFENFLRWIQDRDDDEMLPEELGAATAIRYIINFSGRRIERKWEHINVLEIQGGVPYSSGTVWNSDLTEAKVRDWIGDPIIPGEEPQVKSVTITRMSTYEFVGKIEDLNDRYHMIYIGGVARGMNQTGTNGTSRYNDSAMNGLVYTNIGDRYRVNSTNGEGTALQSLVNGDTDRNFRLSGNDISSAKLQDLIDFADAGYPVIIDNELVSGNDINANRVDNSSYMYEALNKILGMKSGYSVSQALSDPATISRHLNLSKPIIDLLSAPLEYYMDSAGNMNSMGISDENNTFTFTFKIDNLTEAFPQSTTYDVELFLDLDGDGRYTAFEKQSDITVSGGAGQSGGKYQLTADREYTVSKLMPKSAVGLFDWCLKVTKNDGDKRSVRASLTGATRIAPKDDLFVTEINILQIASSLIRDGSAFDYKGAQQRVNFEWQQRELTNATQRNATISTTDQSTNNLNVANRYLRGKDNVTYYEGIYGKLMADVDDFKINIYTVYADELDNLNTIRPVSAGGNRPVGAETNVETYLFNKGVSIYDDLEDILMAFDMLIIGFDDSYGTLSARSAEAISYFISYGKATLFAHDAVTFYANASASGAYGTAAAFILRNVTSLDRYGITNPSFNAILRNSPIAAGETTEDLISRGYYVGWEPKSGRARTVRDIQGFNSHVLKWYNSGNTYNTFMDRSTGEDWGTGVNGTIGRRTSRITQLNEGKITTYPYNINIPAGATGEVGETHGQWHTINMNLDNIVVWYCLSSNYYIHNDAANSFYIYNSGNVTYTGAGHSMNQGNTTGRNTANTSQHPSGVSGRQNTYNTNHSDTSNANWRLSDGIEFEAKLFVNTMIAAYRAAKEKPNLRITDSTGMNKKTFHLLPADGVLLTETIGANDANRTIHFTVTDANLNAGKWIALNLSYHVGDLSEALYLPDLEDGRVNGQFVTVAPKPYINARVLSGNQNDNLQTGIVYSFTLPDGVIAALADPDNDFVTLQLQAVTTLPVPGHAPEIRTGYEYLTIRKLDLFDLN